MKLKINGITFEVKYSLIILIIVYIFSRIVREKLYLYIACYMFIMFHEFCHIFVAQIFNYRCKKIEFSLCGMCANIEIKKNEIHNILIYFAGPMANLLLTIIFRKNLFIFSINLALFLINLVPIYPLDGYNILKNMNINIDKIQIYIYIIIILFGIVIKNITLIVLIIYILLIKMNETNYIKNSC